MWYDLTMPNDPGHLAHLRTHPHSPVAAPSSQFNWRKSTHPVAYQDAVAEMQYWSETVSRGEAAEQVWLLEHPAIYTAGTSAKREHLLTPDRFPVFETGRGGEYTYHGPGQRIVYLALDVRTRFGGDVRAYVHALEDWIIAALKQLDVSSRRGKKNQIGVWAFDPGAPDAPPRKIASIGVRIQRGIALHGVSINVFPDLEHFSGIVACGGDGDNPTSLADLGAPRSMDALDRTLKETFQDAMLAHPKTSSPKS